jgi:WD40 repeat protein
VNGVAVSADGSLALSGGQDRTVRFWNVTAGKELRRVDHDGPVYSVALSADGRHGLSGSADKSVRLWEFGAQSDVGMRRLEGHTAAVFAVIFAAGDQVALSAGADRTVRVWDVASGRLSGLPLVHDSAVVALAITGGDGILAGCDDGTIWLWDLHPGRFSRSQAHHKAIARFRGMPTAFWSCGTPISGPKSAPWWVMATWSAVQPCCPKAIGRSPAGSSAISSFGTSTRDASCGELIPARPNQGAPASWVWPCSPMPFTP